MKSFKNIAAAILLVIVVIIVIQNTESVQTRLLFATFEMPRALLLFITLAVGVAIGLFLGTKKPRSAPPAKQA